MRKDLPPDDCGMPVGMAGFGWREAEREAKGCCAVGWTVPCAWRRLKCDKGIWWMPWRVEAMKDVAPCDKLRGVGSKL